ncbi:UNVERIFIED_CONTAM: hypothetical protein Slati_4376900 [Sesamum latifolium]|uniref:Leucine-rich repeat-containing N-terminal plant-type domain-containing protein n=1 Tax=Sesamum latifolium TaxID=2727402 RepID=A0AAW2SPD0_9LAMI
MAKRGLKRYEMITEFMFLFLFIINLSACRGFQVELELLLSMKASMNDHSHALSNWNSSVSFCNGMESPVSTHPTCRKSSSPERTCLEEFRNPFSDYRISSPLIYPAISCLVKFLGTYHLVFLSDIST